MSYYDDPEFADEYRRRDEEALDWAIEEHEQNEEARRRRATIRVSVVTITCPACGRLLSLSIPRRTDAEETEVHDRPVGHAFSQVYCVQHPASVQLWSVIIREVPE